MSASPAVVLEQDAKEQNGCWRGPPDFLEELMLKVRKPYTITKQRERWTDEEHEKFLEALKLHGRAWRKIEEHIGTKTAVQIRSHAQKFFSKLEREQAAGISGNGHDIDIPPPRPKRKPSHPYPKKAGGASSFSSNEIDFSPVCLSRTPSSLEESSRTGAFTPYASSTAKSSLHRNGSPTSLKLFGKTVLVDVSDEDPPTGRISFERQHGKQALQVTTSLEEESVVESGVTNLLSTSDSSKNKCYDDLKLQMGTQTAEVSSRDQEVPATHMDLSRSNQHIAEHGGMKVQDQITMNNLIALHYASFLAGFQGATTTKIMAGQVNPWQLLSPQMQILPKTEPDKPENEIIRWQSVTDSNSPFIEKSSWPQSNTDEGPCYKFAQEGVGCKRTSMDSDEGEVVEAFSEIKRRKQASDTTTSKEDCRIEKLTSSSCSSGSCTERGSSLSTTLTLESQENTPTSRVGGFVRYRRTNNNRMQTAFDGKASPAN